MKVIDLTGQVFGRLTVVERVESTYGMANWMCACTCGNTAIVRGTRLHSGVTQSCGCLVAETARENQTKHGKSTHPAYHSWSGMKQRCDNPSNQSYKDYGGRCISYPSKWSVFEGFWEDMGDSWKECLTIDRIDVNGNYCKENCRWATVAIQNQNKRTTKKLTYDGKTLYISEWSEITGISVENIRERLSKRKWSVEKTLTTPIREFR